MSLSFNFSFGRLLSNTEKLTPAKINAIVKGIVATLTGTVGTADLDDGAVTPAKTSAGAYFYANATLAAGTYTAIYAPTISAYTDGMVLAFKAGTAPSGAVNFDAGAGAKPLRKHGGIPIAANDFRAGQIVEVRYNTTLVAGGAWEVLTQLGHRITDPVRDVARNLVIDCQLASTLGITADEVVLKDANGNGFLATSVSLTLNIALGVALDGLETGGAESASNWYYIWLISDGTTVHAVLEQAIFGASWPLPAGPDLSGAAFSGYTYMALVGAVFNNSGSAFDSFYQRDHEVFLYQPVAMTGVTGGGGFGFLDVSGIVPAHAKVVSGTIGTSTNDPVQVAVGGSSNSPGIAGAQSVVAGVTTVFNSFFAAGTFRVPLGVTQTLQWWGVNTADYRIVLSSYTV